MKKSLALFIASVTLSLCGLIVTCFVIAGSAENVTLTEDVIYGDASLTDGLTVRAASQRGHHMEWDTTLQFADGGYTDSTQYRHYQFATDNAPRKEPKVSYSDDASLSLFVSYNFKNDPRDKLQQACQKWMEELEPGSQERHTIKLSDYYSYYPIYANLSLPGERYSGVSVSYTVSWYDFLEKFRRYFRIPVLEDEYLEIIVTKSEDAPFSSAESYWTHVHAPGSVYAPYCGGVYTDDAYYFYVTNRADLQTEEGSVTAPEEERLVDTSLIPGGYGVYRIPCVQSERGALADIDGLSTAFSVDERAQIVSLGQSPDSSKLFLHTIEDGTWFLSVIDRASMTLLQKLDIRRNAPYVHPLMGDAAASIVSGENFLLISFRYPTPEIVVLDERGDGYAVRQRIANDDVPEGSRRAQSWWDCQMLNAAYAWNGERLAIVWNPQKMINDNRWSYDMCGVAVAVCEQGKLQFFAEYRSSLDDCNGNLDGLSNLNMKMGLGSAGYGFFVTPKRNALRAHWS